LAPPPPPRLPSATKKKHLLATQRGERVRQEESKLRTRFLHFVLYVGASLEFRGWSAIRRALAGAVIRWKLREIIHVDGYLVSTAGITPPPPNPFLDEF
jgi:hypothetical protein